MRSIQIAKSFFLILLTMSFALPAFAQSEGPSASDARRLRFASRRPVEHLRLQVHDSAGALIHDSGLVTKSDLVWSLLDNNGNVLKAGLYDWTLTVKEPGEAAPRVKRGQFNLENTNEPNGVSAPAPVTVDPGGTVGAIPKWKTPTELEDSIIVEGNGNVAIGSAPGARIRLRVYLKPDDQNFATGIQAVLQPSDYVDPNDPRFNGWTTGRAVAGHAQSKLGGTQGVYGESNSNIGIGVWGHATSEPEDVDPPFANSQGIGVKGTSKSREGIGVLGIASETTGVNYGVKGESASPNGYAGYFVGNVNITGTLTKGMGTFKIDHPLDPENKYLYHSFVESPDMMNIYNGIVTLSKDGSAVVTLPDWFEALNREFRYQLTCIGGFAPVYVAKKVIGNRFKIAGGKPGMEVSWQLTGVRKDAYAEMHRVQVEEMKPVAERGSYMHPEAFGKSSEKGAQQAYEKAQQR